MADDVSVDLVPDIDELVRHLPVVKVSSRKVAETLAEVARATAPKGDTGNYAAGIIVQDTKGGTRVYASDKKSAWIEFGVPGRNQPARWVLRNAAIACGLKFKKRSA